MGRGLHSERNSFAVEESGVLGFGFKGVADRVTEIENTPKVGFALIGRHDFGTFGAADRTSVRTVQMVRVRREGRTVTIDVGADAFLRGMVRRMVACLLEVGLGKMDEEAVRSALAGPGPALGGAAAPAKGLCLRRVAFGPPGGGDENGAHEER